MGIWFRGDKPAEQRSVFPPSWISAESGYAHIDGSRIENAQQAVAVRSAVDLLASICSELPWGIFRGYGPGQATVNPPSYLLDPSGDGHGIEDWIYQAVYSLAYRGNLFGNVLDQTAGYLTQVDLLYPDSVSGRIEAGAPVWSVAGGDVRTVKHWRTNPVPGQVLGQSPIQVHASTIGVQLAAARFGKSFFDADAHPMGILRNTEGPLEKGQSQEIKQKFMAALRGRREPVVMGRAWEWQAIQLNPEESQFLGTLGYSAAECARMFGPGIAEILGYETGGSQTYANLQDRDLQLLKYTVNRWLRRIERILFQFLPRPQYIVFNRDALLETNTMQRYLAYASALDKGWKTVNEVRETENLKPVDWGDEPNPSQWPMSTTPSQAAQPAIGGNQ